MEIIEKIKNYFIKYKQIFIIIFVSICIFTFLIVYILSNKKEEKEISKDNKISYEEVKEETKEELYYYVDIKGEVNNPGVYKISANSRVIDVINIAGGLKENASTRYINLSKFVTDEMVIIIYSNDEINDYKKSETIIIPCECKEVVNDSCLDENLNIDENKLININISSKEELMTLTGIGESKANAIISYREVKKFESIEEIKEVSGISDALYDKIKDFITI